MALHRSHTTINGVESEASVISHMQQHGVRFVQIYGVDNAIVRVPDPVMFGLFMQEGDDAGNKCVAKNGPHERVGVVCKKGGKYRMTIRYVPTPKLQHQINDRCYEVYVNGKCVDVLRNLASAPAKDITTVDLTVTLMPGFNKIRIGSSYTWTPDLDCFDLTPL